MNRKILILSIYPAPYRLGLCEFFSNFYQTDVFFEYSNGDKRDKRWFLSGGSHLLDTKNGRQQYKQAYKNLKQYDLVVLYDYATTEGRKLITRCKRAKIPYVINCDGVILTQKRNFLKDIIKRWLLSKASAYMASGEHAKEYFLRYGAKEDKVFLHGFSTLKESDMLRECVTQSEKIRLREKLGLPLDKKIAIAVGRFIPLKRYDYLLQEWYRIDEQCCLLLIGGGDEYEHYQQIIKKDNLKNVIIEQFHPTEELYDYYKAADIFIHPSSYEAWGLVINEAMAKGLPIVVSNTCTAGLELVKEGQNGYLFPMGQEDVAIERIQNLLNDDSLRQDMANESLKTIQGYTMENMAKTHMQIFEKVLKDGR